MLQNKLAAWLMIALAVMLMVAAFYRLEISENTLMNSIFGVDYTHFFRPASQTDAPYAVAGFYNPFWLLPLLWVFELFGEYRLAVWVVMNLCAFIYVFMRLKMPLWSILPFFVFSGALMSVFVGNVEGLVAFGMVLPLPLGIVVLMLKPQIGLALTLYYVLSAFVYDGWKRAVLILVPVLVLFTASFFLYGTWFLKPLEVIDRFYNTIYFFPIGVPVGLALIVAGVARRNIGYALMAIPFTSPYMIFHTWAFPYMGVVLVLVREMSFLRELVRGRLLALRLQRDM